MDKAIWNLSPEISMPKNINQKCKISSIKRLASFSSHQGEHCLGLFIIVDPRYGFGEGNKPKKMVGSDSHPKPLSQTFL